VDHIVKITLSIQKNSPLISPVRCFSMVAL